MSDYIATAQVRVLPDLSQFTTDLTRDLNKQISKFNASAAKSLKPIQVPVAAGAISKAQMAGIASTAGKANAALAQTSASTKAVNTNLDRFNKQGAKSRATLLGLGTASARLDSALLGLRTAIGSTAVIGLGAGALAAIALGKAIRSLIGLTVSYERELNVFQAVSGASADEMERVAAAAKELGADITLPAVSAADAAVAMSELAKAGLSVQDAIDGARGVLQLATAANIGFAQAVEIAASAINAFQLSGKDAVKVADTLANAANLAQGSILDIGISFQQASAVGEMAGLTFQDTTLYLTQLARAGLKGSDAGTSLRTALIRLINPSAKAAAIIQELGVSIRDEAGNIRPDVFLQFSNAMRGMSKEQQDANLAIIGGQDALRAFAILGRSSTKDFLALRAELRKQGTAADVAAARTKGLGGAYQALQSTLETIGITIGQKVSPGLTDFVNGITATASALAQSEGVAAAFSGAMTGVATALNLVGAAAQFVGPLLLGLANATSKITFGFGTSLVAGILATVVALKAFNAAASLSIAAGSRATATAAIMASQGMIPLLTANIATGAAIGNTAAVLTRFQRVAIGTRAVLAGLLSSWNLWAIGITAAAAGLIYLLTRESLADKATRKLTESTESLASAQANAKSAAEGLSSAQRSAETGQLAIQQAKLARETAATALATSNAAAGSIERRQLEINLATATQNVTFATQDYSKALKDLAIAQAENEKAAAAADAALANQIGTLKAAQRLSQLMQGRFTRAAGPTGFPLGDLLLKATDAAGITDTTTKLEKFNKTILETAADLAVVDPAASRSFRAIAAVQKQLGKPLTPLQWKRLLAEKDLQGITNRILAILEASGTKWGASTLTAILRAMGALPRGLGDSISKAGIAADKEAQIVGRNLGTTMGDELIRTFGLRLSGQLAGLQRQMLDLEIAGASDQARLANLRRQEEKARKLFEGTKPGPTKNKRREELAAIVRERRALEKQIANDAKAAAEATARKIAEANNKADQAILDAISGTRTTAQGKALQAVARREARVQRALEAAADTEQLRDDIKAYNLAIAVTMQELKLVNKRIKDANTKIEAQKRLQEKLRELKRERDRTIREAKEAAQDQIKESLTLDIEFAQTVGNVRKEIKARERLVKLLKQQQSQVKKNSLEWKRLRNEIANEQKAIDELRKQQKERNNATSKMMFEFLTRQQGFAAQVMGNLLGPVTLTGLTPGVTSAGLGATAIGGADKAKGIGSGPLGGRGRFPEGAPRTGLPGEALSQTAALEKAAGGGPTRGQQSVELDLLRQILHTLKTIQSGRSHPEARNKKASGGAAMDVVSA